MLQNRVSSQNPLHDWLKTAFNEWINQQAASASALKFLIETN